MKAKTAARASAAHVMMTRLTTGWMATTFVLGVMAYAVAEDITMTTYYPSPRGFYQTLQTTGNALIAQGAGTRVGVGTAAPVWELDVNGNLRATRFIGPGMLPTGTIGMFGGGCPPGWPRAGDFDGRMLYGAGGYGLGGGGPAHSHADPGHAHWVGAVNAASSPEPGYNHDVNYDHHHNVPGALQENWAGSGMDCNNCDWDVSDGGHRHGFDAPSSSPTWANPVLVPGDPGHTHAAFTMPGFWTGGSSSGSSSVATDEESWPPYITIVFCEAP